MSGLALFSHHTAHVMSEKYPRVLGSIGDSWTVKFIQGLQNFFIFWEECRYRINVCFLGGQGGVETLKVSKGRMSLISRARNQRNL